MHQAPKYMPWHEGRSGATNRRLIDTLYITILSLCTSTYVINKNFLQGFLNAYPGHLAGLRGTCDGSAVAEWFIRTNPVPAWNQVLHPQTSGSLRGSPPLKISTGYLKHA